MSLFRRGTGQIDREKSPTEIDSIRLDSTLGGALHCTALSGRLLDIGPYHFVHSCDVAALELSDHLFPPIELNGGEGVDPILHRYVLGLDGVDLTEHNTRKREGIKFAKFKC